MLVLQVADFASSVCKIQIMLIFFLNCFSHTHTPRKKSLIVYFFLHHFHMQMKRFISPACICFQHALLLSVHLVFKIGRKERKRGRLFKSVNGVQLEIMYMFSQNKLWFLSLPFICMYLWKIPGCFILVNNKNL